MGAAQHQQMFQHIWSKPRVRPFSPFVVFKLKCRIHLIRLLIPLKLFVSLPNTAFEYFQKFQDNLNGIVIGNLSFNSEYSVKIQQFPLSTTEIVNSVSKRKNSTTLNGTFTSMHCWFHFNLHLLYNFLNLFSI